LQDIKDGDYEGKPALFDEFQTLENPALRAFLKLDKSAHGILVREPFETSADYPLKPWDVITKIGDTPIDDQGMIKVGDSLRLRFLYAVQNLAQNGSVGLTVLRDGTEHSVNVPVSSDRPKLINYLEATYPAYF